MKFTKITLTIVATLFLTSCAGFFNKDNAPKPAPLTSFKATLTPHHVWITTLKTPVGFSFNENTLFVASERGAITALNPGDGHVVWSSKIHATPTTAPGVGNGLVVVGCDHGTVAALHQMDGTPAWRTTVTGQILAKPLIAQNRVIIKTTNGGLYVLEATAGKQQWSLKQNEPDLILRGASTPLVKSNALFVGFANGHLAKINLQSGMVYWERPIAIPEGGFAIDRMIDIDANPTTTDYHLFAVTYQGNLAALDEETGRLSWSHPLSSYTGMAIRKEAVYISDAEGHLLAFNIQDGAIIWQQDSLLSRHLTAPVIMGNFLVVGDGLGYLHWFNLKDGQLAAREFVGSAIVAAPVVEQNTLYALTTEGKLVAYRIT